MERYTLNLELPEILCLRTTPMCKKSDEENMLHRSVFLHTHTGAVVEILFDRHFVIEGDHMELSFSDIEENDGKKHNYTALLLNKPGRISEEAGMRALKAVSNWFLKYCCEYNYINSLKWVDGF